MDRVIPSIFIQFAHSLWHALWSDQDRVISEFSVCSISSLLWNASDGEMYIDGRFTLTLNVCRLRWLLW